MGKDITDNGMVIVPHNKKYVLRIKAWNEGTLEIFDIARWAYVTRAPTVDGHDYYDYDFGTDTEHVAWQCRQLLALGVEFECRFEDASIKSTATAKGEVAYDTN